MKDGIEADVQIPILLNDDSPCGISKSMGLAMIGFADYFARVSVDLLLVLGDRFETLAVCCSAFNANIPIVHLHGGETTQGAQDEAFRHAITKMSMLHFTSTAEYQRRVIQLGESPDRVFNVGAIGVENALTMPLLTREELADEVSENIKNPYAMVTYHPVTLEHDSATEQCMALLDALDEYREWNYIITKANADAGGRKINSLLEMYAEARDNVVLVDSLGVKRYLSALLYADFVIGNSSSGLIEAPSFGIPTINIGDRQLGRAQGASVLNCLPEKHDIVRCIRIAVGEQFQKIAKQSPNPYQGIETSRTIIQEMLRFLSNPSSVKKSFYDLDLKEK